MATLSDHSVNNDDDEYAGTDDDIPPVPQDLPPLDVDLGTESQNPAEEGDIGAILDAHAASTGAKPTQVRAKRVVRNPQPKLDPARLSGERGIPTLLRHFEKVKFKGKGHEKEDLNLLMHRMEHWAHRLCPRMTFDEVIARIEKLGSKKPVQVCVKKIRLDIPLLDDDIMPQTVENIEDGVESREKPVENDDWDFDDLFADRSMTKVAAANSNPVQEDFDDLFADRPTTKVAATSGNPIQDDFDDLFADNSSTMVPSTDIHPPQTPTMPKSTNNTLTAEQLERIEEKKNQAARRKAARMAQERAEKNQQSQETKEKVNNDSQENSKMQESQEIKETESTNNNKGENNQESQELDEDLIEIMEQSEKQIGLPTSSENNLNEDVFIVEDDNNLTKMDTTTSEVINID